MRLPNGYGSVYQLQPKKIVDPETGEIIKTYKRRCPWVARVTTGRSGGSQQYKYLGYYPKRADALAALEAYHRSPAQFSNATFWEVFELMRERRANDLTDRSLKQYDTAVKIFSEVFEETFVKLTVGRYQTILDSSDRGYSMKSTAKSVLQYMYRTAVIEGIVTMEYSELIGSLYLGKRPQSSRNRIAREDIDTMWTMKDESIYSVMLMMIYTGVRVSELLNLKKEDVHLEERWFSIKSAKTAAGIRDVPIHKAILPLFQDWMDDSPKCEYLLNLSGHQMKYQWFKWKWDGIMEAQGWQYTAHETRHTFVSMARDAHMDDFVLKAIVGHTTPGTTEVYTHISMEAKLEAIDLLSVS